MSGYSQRSLKDKLGIKPDFSLVLINTPDSFVDELNLLQQFSTKLEKDTDYIHFFTKSKQELENTFPELKKCLNKDGMLWISWPKGSSKVGTDLNENTVMQIGLDNGLVDVKVASIDEIWSGLKFVYRLKDR